MNENYRKLYDAITAQNFDLGDYDTFLSKMQTSEQRRSFYDAMASHNFNLGDYDVYEDRLKKKDQPTELESSGEERLAGLAGEVDLHNTALDFNKQFKEYSSLVRDPKYVDADLTKAIEEYTVNNPVQEARTISVPRMAGEPAMMAQEHTVAFTEEQQKAGIEEVKKNFILDKEREALNEMKGQLLSELTEEQKNDTDLLRDMSDKLFLEYGLDLDLDGDGQYNEQWLAEDMLREAGATIVDMGAAIAPYAWAAMNPAGPSAYGKVRKEMYREMSGVTEEIKAGQTQYSATSEGIANSFENGNVWNGVRQLSVGLAGAAPQIVGTVALASATGGAAVPTVTFGLIGGSGYYQQTELADERAVAAGMTPLYDNNFQRLLGASVVGVGDAAYSYLGLKIAAGAGSKAVNEQMVRGWFKAIGVEPTSEALEEVMTELSTMAVEGTVGNAKFTTDEIRHRLIDAGLLGYGSGVGFALAGRARSYTNRAQTAANSRSETANQNPDLLDMQDALARQEGSSFLDSFVQKEYDKAIWERQNRVDFFEMLSVRHPESMDAVQDLDGQIEYTAQVLTRYDAETGPTTPAALASKQAAQKALKAKLEGLIKDRQTILDKHINESVELNSEEQLQVRDSRASSTIDSRKVELELLIDEINHLKDGTGTSIEIAEAEAKKVALVEHITELESLHADAIASEVKVDIKPINISSGDSFIKNEIESALAGEGSFAHMTAENPGNAMLSPEENVARNAELKKALDDLGATYVEIDGYYDRDEKSFFVKGLTVAEAMDLGIRFDQESVAHSKGMLYTKGEHKGTMEPATGKVDVNQDMDNYYSTVQTEDGPKKYSVGYDWGNYVEIPQDTDTDLRERLENKIKEGPVEPEVIPVELQEGVDEDIFVKYEGKSPWKKFTNKLEFLRRKWFSARAFKTVSGKAMLDNMSAQINAVMHNVEADIRVFNRLYNEYRGDKAQLLNDYDAAIRGDKEALARLDSDFAVHARAVRTRVSQLSQALLDSGYFDESSEADRMRIAIIKRDIGSYLTRSFEAYDNKNWKSIVSQQVVNDAKNYTRKDIAEAVRIEYDNKIEGTEGLTFEEYLDVRVEGTVNSYLDKPDVDAILGGASPKSVKDIRKHRKDLAPEILALLGEHKSPMRNYAESVAKLVQAVEKTKALTELRERGLGTFFFKTPQGIYSQQVASEDSKSPLNGLYTTPEMAAELNRVNKAHGKILKTYMKFLSGIKWAKTIGSLATHSKNVVGNVGFMWANGHTDITQFATAYKALKNRFKSDEALRAAYVRYMELGLVNQSAGLGEIKSMFEMAGFDEAMGERTSAKENINVLGRANVMRKKVGKWAENLYQAEDDFFKIVAFENERNRYSKAMFNKPPSKLTAEQQTRLDDYVAEKIKNTYPTYDRVPEAINLLKRSPVLGNFISFTAESYRVAFNSAAIAVKETKSDNPEIRKIGYRRLAGMISYNALKTGLLSTLSLKAGAGLTGLVGMALRSEEEEEKMKAIRSFVRDFSKDSDLIILQADNGKLVYIDATASDPYGEVFKNINMIAQSGGTIEGFAEAVVSGLEPFLGVDMGTAMLQEIYANKDKYGRQIYSKEQDLDEQMKDVTAYVYKTFEPGTITSARKIIGAENKTLEVLGQLTGFKPYTIDIKQQMGFKAKHYAKRMKEINNLKYTDYDDANEKMEALYQEYHQDVKNAELLGLGTLEIRKQIMDWDSWMSKKKANDIVLGRYRPLKKPKIDR